MAAIISLRDIGYKEELWAWLMQNIQYEDYLIDNVSLTFINDDDATAFCLRFGMQTATQNPELLNRKRE
jgi:hypothetical protein